jgi:hypothetical protein
MSSKQLSYRNQLLHDLALTQMLDDFDKLEESSDSSSSESDTDSEDNSGAGIAALATKILTQQYFRKWDTIPKFSGMLEAALVYFKQQRPTMFRSHARMSPTAFDALISFLRPLPEFYTNARTPQLPLESQALVTLKRFGSCGNAASVYQIAEWARIGQGTVDKVRRQVISAVLNSKMKEQHIIWPEKDSAEREGAKKVVQDLLIPECRGGWCMINGTLVPLFAKPWYYGERFFDRKTNYSLNVQVYF